MNRCLFAAIIWVGISTNATRADDSTVSWVGQSVFGKKPFARVLIFDQPGDQRTAPPLNGPYPIQVREDRNGWLRVHDGRRDGWVKKEDFVLTRDAVAYFSDRIRADGADSFAWYGRGVNWDRQTEVNRAVMDLNEYVRLDPRSADGFCARGFVLNSKGDLDRAIQDFDEAVRLDPTHARALNNRGAYWLGKGDCDRAIRDFDEVLRLDPKNAAALSNRATGWSGKREYDRAIRDLDEALRLDPTMAPLFANRGEMCMRKGDFDRAVNDFDEALRLDPQFVFVKFQRGHAWAGKGEYEKAIADFDEVVRVHSMAEVGYISRAEMRVKLRQYAEAVKDFEAATRLGPPVGGSLLGYAGFLATCPDRAYRNGEKAVTMATTAIQSLGPAAGYLWRDTLAAAYAETGAFDQAAATQKEVLADKSLEPANRASMEAKLKLYEQKKPFPDR